MQGISSQQPQEEGAAEHGGDNADGNLAAEVRDEVGRCKGEHACEGTGGYEAAMLGPEQDASYMGDDQADETDDARGGDGGRCEQCGNGEKRGSTSCALAR